MFQIINSFRELHGRSRVWNWDSLVSGYCEEHSRAMANCGELYHADQSLLNGWSEIVAKVSYSGENFDIIKSRLVYDVIGRSEGHKAILLNSSIIAHALVVANGWVYATIRGR